MPIITFEYSSNLHIDSKIKSFLLDVHQLLVKEIKTDLKTCRSTILKRDNFFIADGDNKNAFIILNIRMLPGRTDDIKDRAGKLLLEEIEKHFSTIYSQFDTQIRVHLTETDKRHYYGLEK